MLEASNETMLFLETMTSCCVMSYLYLRPDFNIYKNRVCILSTYFWFASQQKTRRQLHAGDCKSITRRPAAAATLKPPAAFSAPLCELLSSTVNVT